MKYLKLYEEFNTDIKYSISWQEPSDELINQEMHELLNNCEFFLIKNVLIINTKNIHIKI